MGRLIGTKYKTFAGASKRASFERAMNPSEYARGDVAHRYSYRVVEVDGAFRVERTIVKEKNDNT